MVLSVGKGKSLLASTSSQLRQRGYEWSIDFTLVESGFSVAASTCRAQVRMPFPKGFGSCYRKLTVLHKGR